MAQHKTSIKNLPFIILHLPLKNYRNLFLISESRFLGFFQKWIPKNVTKLWESSNLCNGKIS